MPSLYWGGWSPELLDVELPASWPVAVINELRPLTLPNGQKGYFRQASELIGTSETNDFVFGDLHRALRQQLFDHVKDVTDVLLPGALPDHPAVRYSAGPIPSAQLAALRITQEQFAVVLAEGVGRGVAQRCDEALLDAHEFRFAAHQRHLAQIGVECIAWSQCEGRGIEVAAGAPAEGGAA